MAAGNATFSPLAHFLTSPTEWTQNATFTTLVTGLSIFLVSSLFLRPRDTEKVYYLGGIPILTAWPFFTRRYDFMYDNFKKSDGKMFRFNILNHRVTAMSGEKLRKVFFNDPGLNMTEGYRVLMGGAPEIGDVKMETGADEKDVRSEVDDGFTKRLLTLMRRDRISETLPTLLSDLDSRMSEWEDGQRINPFKNVYDLVFQMTVRMATCQELAEDKQAIDDITKSYWTIEKCATPVSLLLPWLPSATKKAKEKATTDLYNTFLKYVQLRRNSGTDSTEPIDLLIAQGHSDPSIITTIMGIIFAGVINTGMTACWLLLHLGANPEWKERAVTEYRSLVEKYSSVDSSEALHRRLSSIPMEAWEDELPSIDLLIRETLRLTLSGTALRRNLGPDMKVDDVTLKHGEFLAYQISDTHLNPNIYTDPMKFDPNRYLEGREEDRKETFAYLGWGVGRHPCAGMKIAKLEVKLILALFLMEFDYKLVDKSGKYPKALPVQDRNDIQQARPLGDPCYLEVHHVQA